MESSDCYLATPEKLGILYMENNRQATDCREQLQQ